MDDIVQRHLDCLSRHPVYAKLNSIANIRAFMEVHVFAVWDFMSLLKALQRQLTCVKVPWNPSPYGAVIARFINEIVLDEESDRNIDGIPMSHFEMYLQSMREVGACTNLIEEFVKSLDLNILPEPIRHFVGNNLHISSNSPVHKIAAAFFYGREKIIPSMFQQMVNVVEGEASSCTGFVFYLKRHIELDEGSHGPLANQCLNLLCDNEKKRLEAREVALESSMQRSQFWDYALLRMDRHGDYAQPDRRRSTDLI